MMITYTFGSVYVTKIELLVAIINHKTVLRNFFLNIIAFGLIKFWKKKKKSEKN